jgi:hypothetical protein
MNRLVTLSSSATAGILPLSLLLLLVDGAQKFHGVTRLRTRHLANLSLEIKHEASTDLLTTELSTSKIATIERKKVSFRATYDSEAKT